MGESMREKKDISYTIRRSSEFPVVMIGEGILVGAAAGGHRAVVPDLPELCVILDEPDSGGV